MFYKSYIQPHLDYCNIIWGNSAKGNLMKIERLQKRACKVILNYNVDNIYTAMNDLKVMTIYERVFLRKAKFMFKIFQRITPSYINEMFTRRTEQTSGNNVSQVLRSDTANNFLLPKPNIELYKGSLAYSGPVIWNYLSKELKSAPTVNAFHNRCIKWMKT